MYLRLDLFEKKKCGCGCLFLEVNRDEFWEREGEREGRERENKTNPAPTEHVETNEQNHLSAVRKKLTPKHQNGWAKLRYLNRLEKGDLEGRKVNVLDTGAYHIHFSSRSEALILTVVGKVDRSLLMAESLCRNCPSWRHASALRGACIQLWFTQGYQNPVPFLQLRISLKGHPSFRTPMRLTETSVQPHSTLTSF